MYCRKCGIPLSGKENFCPNCGERFIYGQRAFFYDKKAEEAANASLIFGILSLVFSFTTLIIGVVFSILAFMKAGDYKYYTGSTNGKALAGKVMAIISLAFVGFYIIVVLFFIFITFLGIFTAV